MRIGFLCMQSEFSVRPLQALLAAGHDVRFVMRPLPRSDRHAQILGPAEDAPHTLREASAEPFLVAASANIPRYVVGDASSPAVEELVSRERVDVLVISFFNQLLRPSLLCRLPLGALNAHPSLLPRYRGPAPLFWTFKDAAEQTGVCVHRVDAGEDDGAVFTRTALPLEVGARGEDVVSRLAAVAAVDVLTALERLASGSVRPEPQDEALATRAPRPRPEDRVIDPGLGAREVFSFVRGVGRWNDLRFKASGTSLRVLDAESFEEDRSPPGDFALVGDRLTLACRDGSVVLRVRGPAVRAA